KESSEVSIALTLSGTVVKIEDRQVLVDIGYKTAGVVPISELSSLHIEVPGDVVNEGDKLSLKVKKVEDDEDVLSKKAVDAETAWKELEEKFQNGEIFETEIKEIVKGGLV